MRKERLSRDYVLLSINGKRVEVRGPQAFMMLADFLRYERRMTGTKIVCAEGDCGACTVLRAYVPPGPAAGVATKSVAKSGAGKGLPPAFRAINACIFPVALADGSEILTVESLSEGKNLGPVQEAMVNCNGSQCGFCTPGFVMALSQLFEDKREITEKRAKNYLTGNLCRCTGYQPILEASLAVDPSSVPPLRKRYPSGDFQKEWARVSKIPVSLDDGTKSFCSPTTVREALAFKRANRSAQLFSSATDLGVSVNKGRTSLAQFFSVQQIPELYRLDLKNGHAYVGAKVTLSELETFLETHAAAPEFRKLLTIFASLQIKNVATLAGNVANGSPIGDTLPFLLVMDATVHAVNARGSRKIPFSKFYKGYRETALAKDELIVGISFRVPDKSEHVRLYKVSQRKDLDISCVTAGFLISTKNRVITSANIAYGGNGPTVLRLPKTERFLKSKPLNDATIEKAGEILASELKPRSDVRGSDRYRRVLSQNLFRRFAQDLSENLS